MAKTRSKTAKKAGGRSAQAKTSPTKPIITYDFKHPARVSKAQVRTLENLHSNFARILAASFSSIQRSIVDVDIAFVDQTTYAEFIMSLSNPSCSYTFNVEEFGGPAILDFALPLADQFIDRSFGGVGADPPQEPRVITAVERQVMGKAVTRALSDLEATWEPLLKIQVSDAELETNPEFIQVASPSDTVILIAFEVNTQHASGLINLCYPYFTLERVMSLLHIQTWAGGKWSGAPQARLDQLKRVKADVRVVWGRGTLPPDEVARLKVGDTLLLDTRTDDPAMVYVEDLPLFLARPGSNDRGNRAAELLRSVTQSESKRYE
ncbi:MAG: FliM/FliN family flagellar motor switch protein [Candidatus Latescibacteria bacterium]|jgi:flagellar motor switch protein FliM|nr:FliM/FliN family flagellar motor switch protein [Candidatus Latescibacterota bacterium]